MPLLDDLGVVDLLKLAKIHYRCGECNHKTALDYCRSCDQYYWLHQPRCQMYSDHNGHRLTIVPFVEDRSA